MTDKEIQAKIQELTADWLDLTGHLIRDRISYVSFERDLVVLDGDFTQEDLNKVVQVLETIAAEPEDGNPDPGAHSDPDNPTG